tara:strand:+ start:147 stop:701 length:555 start_codon:yes stop_codon:yes gene_type:complete
MSYATIEEAWGQDFNRKKKSKRDKRQEKIGRQIADETIDSEIVIPKMADTRQKVEDHSQEIPNLDSFNGYDRYSNRYGTPYQNSNNTLSVTSDDILENNRKIEQRYNRGVIDKSNSNTISSELSKVEELGKNVVQITDEKYKQLTEGFTNQSDEQFNQLLLYIFTGIFYLFMLDLMYQLGKKSY